MIKFEPVPENFEVVQRLFRLNNFTPTIGVEVGVRRGAFAKHLLLNNPGLKIICVDSYPAYQDLDHTYTLEEQKKIKEEAAENLEEFENRGRVRWMYEPSHIAAASVKADGLQVDFVFIDGEHTVYAAKLDIISWQSQVRSGGWLMGHDYRIPGVKRAVDAFVELMGISPTKLTVTKKEHGDVWAIQV